MISMVVELGLILLLSQQPSAPGLSMQAGVGA